MDKEELISVIIPAYNVEKYIAKCIESLLAQTYKNMELIFVDDGSTDATGKICVQYAANDRRIQVIHQENQGVSSARNKALEIASGQYVGFCDADDWIEEDMYEYLYHLIKANQAEIATCGAWMEYTDRKYIIGCAKREGLEFNKEQAIAELHRRRNMCDWMCCKLFSAALLKDVWFDGKLQICEDYVFQCDAFERCNRVVCGSIAKYHYRQRKESASNCGYSDRFEKGFDADCKYINRYIQLYPKYQKSFMCRYMLEAMGLITAMIKGNNVNKKRLQEIQKMIRKHLLEYLFTTGPEIYLKGSAVMLSINIYLFELIYKKMKKLND